MGRAGIERTGQRLGSILVTGKAPALAGAQGWQWNYVCDCGNTGTAGSNHLLSKTSCNECARRCQAEKVTSHGHRKGGKATSLYSTWQCMRARCENKEHKSWGAYGGRGIKVCTRWESFDNFAADVPAKPKSGYQLDRINNDGNYEPGNVRWSAPQRNSRNRRSNVFLTYNGKTLCMAEWAEHLAIPYTMLKQRINRGWSVAMALDTPAVPRSDRASFRKSR